MGVMAAMLIINPIYSWLVSRIDQNRIIPYIYTFFILNLGLFHFYGLLRGPGSCGQEEPFIFGLCLFFFCSVSIWVTMINFYNHTESKKFLNNKCRRLSRSLFWPRLQNIFLLKFVEIPLFQTWTHDFNYFFHPFFVVCDIFQDLLKLTILIIRMMRRLESRVSKPFQILLENLQFEILDYMLCSSRCS